VVAGTILARSHVGLEQWLRAVELLCSTPAGLTPRDLQRELGLKSWRSAAFICKKLHWAMGQPPLRGELARKHEALYLPMDRMRALSLLLCVKPVAGMPRPGANRQRSVWAEVNEEFREH
jgi:hypothetical protein